MVQANILKITQVEKYQGLKTTSHLSTTFNKRKEKGLSIKKPSANEKPRAADLYPN